MTEKAEFVDRSLEEVLEQASRKVGVRKEALMYEVLREERGFLGAGSRLVAIRVDVARRREQGDFEAASARLRPSASGGAQAEVAARAGERRGREDQVRDAMESAGAEEPAEDRGPDPSATSVAGLVRGLVRDLAMDLEASMEEQTDRLVLNLSGGDRDLLVERRGELLDALQYLVNRMARKSLGTFKRIQLESDGFRSDREDELRGMALDAAERAVRSGSTVRLPLLNPYERRIVHLAISQRPGVTTESEGDGFVKRVTVRPSGTPRTGGSARRRRRPGSRD